MARKRKEEQPKGDPMWLITFSDLTTLLLTFFVLILSMSSMDRTVLTQVNVFSRSVAFTSPRSAGRIPQEIMLVLRLVEEPLTIMEKPNRFKDLLFPDYIMPEGMNRSTLYANIQVLQRPEGVALVLSDKLLFAPASSELTPQARSLMRHLAELVLYMTAPVNISGHTGVGGDLWDPRTQTPIDPYELSMDRAMAVMAYFVEHGAEQRRFSLSGYGPHWPYDPPPGEAPPPNRRVEILLKTQPYLGGY